VFAVHLHAYFAVYLAQIHLTPSTTPRSFGPNFPRSGTHSYQKAIFRHTLGLKDNGWHV